MENSPKLFENTKIAFEHSSDKQMKKAYRLFSLMKIGWLMKAGKVLIVWAFKLHLPIKKVILDTLFGQFCGGESIEGCQQTIDTLAKSKIKTVLSYSVEGQKNEKGFLSLKNETLSEIKFVSKNSDIVFCVIKLSGLGDSNIMTRLQQEKSLNENEKKVFQLVEKRLDEIIEAAFSKDIKVMLDAEESWFQETLDNLALQMIKKYNRKKAIVYNTYQMYRHDTLSRLKSDIENAQKEGYFLGVKIVRGAYVDKERERAQELHYNSPIHKDKQSTDKDYDLAVQLCIENVDVMGVCVASHNEQSCLYATECMQQAGLENNDARIVFVQLLGMGDYLSYPLAKKGYNVAKYVPYGPVKHVIPYLFRRLEENSSITKQGRRESSLLKEELTRRKKEKYAS